MGNRILYVITEYCGGMRPYAWSILNSIWSHNSYAIIVIRDKSMKNEFSHLDQNQIQFIEYPCGKLKRILFRLYPTLLIRAINDTLKNRNIDIVHTLTGELILASYFHKILKKAKVLHTVHDARTHDTKYLTLKHLLNDKLFIEYPNNYLNRLAQNTITNSKDQQKYLKAKYPSKNCFYAPFPTLITPEISSGKRIVPELEKYDNYILFFGRVSLYKGVHVLYNMYCSHPELHKYPLVIAGQGELYFNRNDNDNNVIFINRFFNDEELSNLFSKAAIVVYPYISATQSGVQSIAAYFGKKIILSNIPFFAEIANNVSGISIVNTNDHNEFANEIISLINSQENTLPYYEKTFAIAQQNNILNDCYSKLLINCNNTID